MGQPLRNCNFNPEDDDEHMDSWDTLFSHKPMCKADDKKYLCGQRHLLMVVWKSIGPVSFVWRLNIVVAAP